MTNVPELLLGDSREEKKTSVVTFVSSSKQHVREELPVEGSALLHDVTPHGSTWWSKSNVTTNRKRNNSHKWILQMSKTDNFTLIKRYKRCLSTLWKIFNCDVETIEHLFDSCSVTSQFWQDLYSWFNIGIFQFKVLIDGWSPKKGVRYGHNHSFT